LKPLKEEENLDLKGRWTGVEADGLRQSGTSSSGCYEE